MLNKINLNKQNMAFRSLNLKGCCDTAKKCIKNIPAEQKSGASLFNDTKLEMIGEDLKMTAIEPDKALKESKELELMQALKFYCSPQAGCRNQRDCKKLVIDYTQD